MVVSEEIMDEKVMIEAFLTLVEDISRSLHAREYKKEDLFSQVVEPLFHTVEPIVDDYVSVFLHVHERSEEEDDWESTLEHVRKRRQKMLLTRKKVRKLVMLLKEFKIDALDNFSISILSFFYSTNHETVRNAATNPGELLNLLRQLEKLSKIVASPEEITSIVASLKQVKKKICRDIDELLFDSSIYGRCQSFRDIDDSSITKEIVHAHSGVTMENLERAWDNIATNYAHLRFHLPRR